MKKFVLSLCVLCMLLMTFSFRLSAASVIGDANGDGVVDVSDITTISAYILGTLPYGEGWGEACDANSDGNVDVSDITAVAAIILTGGDPVADNTVLVKYNGTTATVKAASNISSYLNIKVDGADVSIVADSTLSKEINYILSGTTTDGMFYMDGEYKCTLTLNGVNIKNADASAIQIDCGKRIAVVVADSTENTLIDGSKSKKAAFFINGHAEFEGGGTLNIKGNTKHAYRSDEYTQLKKKFTGTINILGAASDGIHVAEYFQMNNGNIVIKGVTSDGIQAEQSDEEELDGDIIINGGSLDITADGPGGEEEDTTTVVPADSYKLYVNIPESSGNTGGGGPGMPPGGGGGGGSYWTNVYLYDSSNNLIATLTKTVTLTSSSGNSKTFYYYDFGKAMAQATYYVKSDNYNDRGRNYTIRSGAMSFALTGKDVFFSISSSYSTSGTIRTFSVANVTSSYANATIGGEANTYSATAIKADHNITINGGSFTINNSGDMSKGIKCDSLLTINDGTFTFNTSGTTKVYSNDPVYCTAIKTYDYIQNGGSLTIKATGLASRGISTDNDMTVNDGTNTITCSGAGSLLGSYDSYAAKGYCVNGNLNIVGGTHIITCSGKGGKGICVDGTAIFGTTETSPVIKVTTTGAVVGGSGENLIGTAKAVKVQGGIDVNNGEITINTSTGGAEGFESKSFINFNGGKFYAKCYDDCINTRGNLIFNGTYVYAYSNGNDAIDSNNNVSGGITINGGAVFCFSTKGSPEEGLDIDNKNNIVINGGYLFAAGGRQSSNNTLSTSCTQTYGVYTNSTSFTTARYYTVTNGSGKNLFTVKFPVACNSQLTVVTAPGLTKNSTNYVKYGTTAPTSYTTNFNNLIWTDVTVATSANQFSFTGK